MFNVGGAEEDRLGYVLCAPAVDGLVNAGVILMHELMGTLRQGVDAMEDSSHDYVISGACHMNVVLLPAYKVVVGHEWWATEDAPEDLMLRGKVEEVLMLLLPQLRSDGRRLHNRLHDGQQQFSGKWNMEVGVLLGVVVLMVVMVTVAEGVGIVVVGSYLG